MTYPTVPVPLDERLAPHWRVRHDAQNHVVEYAWVTFSNVTLRVTTSKKGINVWGPSSLLAHLAPIEDHDAVEEALARAIELVLWLRKGPTMRQVGEGVVDEVHRRLLR